MKVYKATKFNDIVILLNRNSLSNKATVVTYNEHRSIREIPLAYFDNEYVEVGKMVFDSK